METTDLVIHNNKVFKPVQTSLFTAWEEVAIPTRTPSLAWRGALIPLTVWWPIVAFMRKNKAHECMVRLYYNTNTREWKAWAWPQKYGTGMTIKEITDHPMREPQWNTHFGPGWEPAGTVHHHCMAGAFQSGTDSADEKNQPGIHITLGKMNDMQLDYHGRASFRGEFYTAGLSSWFEKPAEVTPLPWQLHEPCMKFYALEHLPPDTKYPEDWDRNLIEEPKVTYLSSSAGYQGGHISAYSPVRQEPEKVEDLRNFKGEKLWPETLEDQESLIARQEMYDQDDTVDETVATLSPIQQREYNHYWQTGDLEKCFDILYHAQPDMEKASIIWDAFERYREEALEEEAQELNGLEGTPT